MDEHWLGELERSLAEDAEGEGLPIALVLLARAAGGEVELDADETLGAVRRALLLLAAGGDPSRGLDLRGRAVSALAEDVGTPERREVLGRGLEELRRRSAGLPHVNESLAALLAESDIAWRAFACALLAEELAGE